jgi:hypothetical protein
VRTRYVETCAENAEAAALRVHEHCRFGIVYVRLATLDNLR